MIARWPGSTSTGATPLVVAFALLAAWSVAGRERIVIRDGVMAHRRELGPLHGRTRRMQRDEVGQVQVEPYTSRWWHVGRDSSSAETIEHTGLAGGALRHGKLRFGAMLGREDVTKLLGTIRQELRR